MSDPQRRTVYYALQWAHACQIEAGVLDYASRGFLPEADCTFCAGCALAGGPCDPRNTHLYGSFEADRWNGLYVYYCPLGLGFIASTVYAEGRAEWAVVTGPLVIGSLDDTLALLDGGAALADSLSSVPVKSPEDVTGLSRLQAALCAFLSERSAAQVEAAGAAQAELHNALYQATADAGSEGFRYPLALEKALRRMITQGDRQGARELINQLLGQLYFSEDGDFKRIRDNAKGLVVLFSRAAIEGGADARQIFGQTRRTDEAIDRFCTLDELSQYLTSVFYRFVSYVFDFGRVKNADLVHKVIAYVRAHCAERVTLDDVAAEVHLSRSHLSRELGGALGMPFTDFVNGVRVEKSKALLSETSLPLAEIAGLAGFSDQSYFTKVFRKNTGVSPKEYRRSRGLST